MSGKFSTPKTSVSFEFLVVKFAVNSHFLQFLQCSGRVQALDNVRCLFACLVSLLQFYFKSLFLFSHNWVNKQYSILRYSVMLARVLSARHKDVFYSAGLWVASLRICSESLFSRFIKIFTQNSLRAEAQFRLLYFVFLAWRVIRSLCQSEVTGVFNSEDILPNK